MKVTTFDSKLVRPIDKGGTFYLALMGKAGPRAIQRINWPKKQDDNSDNLIRHFKPNFCTICIPKNQLE